MREPDGNLNDENRISDLDRELYLIVETGFIGFDRDSEKSRHTTNIQFPAIIKDISGLDAAVSWARLSLGSHAYSHTHCRLALAGTYVN